MKRAIGVAVLFLVASGCGGAVKKDLQDTQNRVSTLETNLKSSTEAQTKIGEKIGQIDEQLEALKLAVVNLIKEETDRLGKKTEGDVTILDGKVGDLDKRIGQLQADQGSIRSQLSGVAKTLEAMRADLGKLESALQNMRAAEKAGGAPKVPVPEKTGEK